MPCCSLPPSYSLLPVSPRAASSSKHTPVTSRSISCLRSSYCGLHFNQSLLCRSQIAMMQSANLRQRNDFAFCWRLDLASHRRIPFQRLMRPHFISDAETIHIVNRRNASLSTIALQYPFQPPAGGRPPICRASHNRGAVLPASLPNLCGRPHSLYCVQAQRMCHRNYAHLVGMNTCLCWKVASFHTHQCASLRNSAEEKLEVTVVDSVEGES